MDTLRSTIPGHLSDLFQHWNSSLKSGSLLEKKTVKFFEQQYEEKNNQGAAMKRVQMEKRQRCIWTLLHGFMELFLRLVFR